MYLYFLLINLN